MAGRIRTLTLTYRGVVRLTNDTHHNSTILPLHPSDSVPRTDRGHETTGRDDGTAYIVQRNKPWYTLTQPRATAPRPTRTGPKPSPGPRTRTARMGTRTRTRMRTGRRLGTRTDEGTCVQTPLRLRPPPSSPSCPADRSPRARPPLAPPC
jgi:hypothetical protein